MTAVRVGPATPADRDAIWPMLTELHAHEGVPVPGAGQDSALRRLLAEPRLGRAFVARQDGRAVGYAVVVHGFSLEFGGTDAFLDELFVQDGVRSQGVGALLIDAAEAHCRAAGVVALHLEVGDANPRAYDLYRRRGFVDHDRHLMTLRFGSA